METKQVTHVGVRVENLMHIRTMSDVDWVERYGSGTLRKNKRLGMRWKDHYLHERICFEFGYGFECVATTRVTFNDAYTAPDAKPLTEAGWHADRMIDRRIFEEDMFEVKYIIVEYEKDVRKEGVGVILRETSCSWIPAGRIVFAIIAEYDSKKDCWLDAVNPF